MPQQLNKPKTRTLQATTAGKMLTNHWNNLEILSFAISYSVSALKKVCPLFQMLWNLF